jgi:hypothetical protein
MRRVCGCEATLSLARNLIFMMPEVIHQAIVRLHFETKVIRLPPGF